MRDPEWVRWCVMQYVRSVSGYRLRKAQKEGRIAELRADLEAVGAIEYDREGGASTYVDRRPELLDTIDGLIDDLQGDMEREEREYHEARALFAQDEDATIVWMKYGERMTWAAVGRQLGYSAATCRRKAQTGLGYIFDRMPREYRRAPVNAEDWEQ